MPAIPHFALPFRLAGTVFAVNEQDSDQDVAACVEAVLRCPQGFRPDLPGFGTPDQTFSENGADVAAVRAAVAEWEPRADPDISHDAAALADEAIDRVRIDLTGGAT